MPQKQWSVELVVTEAGDLTQVHAVLLAEGAEVAHGSGEARRRPGDPPVPRVGDELATARALYALADRLMDITAEDIDLAAGRG